MTEAEETAFLKEHFETERTATLWGQPYQITPRVVEEVLGDGRQLIGFASMDSRPNYYVARIDSGWNIDNYADGELLIDHADELMDAIEEQFGCCRCDDCWDCYGRECRPGDCQCECHQCRCVFPVFIHHTAGVAWFALGWPQPTARVAA